MLLPSLTTTYTAEADVKEGSNTYTLFALYPHQHLHVTESERFEKFTFASPRGEMKVIAGNSFSTDIPFLGVLPAFPNSPPSGTAPRQADQPRPSTAKTTS